ILWWRASGLPSPTVVPASTVPWRWIAPVRARIASSSVVLPLWNGPTSAMHRGPLGLLPFCPIRRLLVSPTHFTQPGVLRAGAPSSQAVAALARGRDGAPRRRTDDAGRKRGVGSFV